MAVETIKVPDLGGADAVEVIEIAVAPGDEVAEEDTLLVLESDKATMDVPSPKAGVVKKILVKLGDSVSQGSAIVDIDVSAAGGGDDSTPEQPEGESQDSASSEPESDAKPEPATKAEAGDQLPSAPAATEQQVTLPDLGTDDAVEVIELAVAEGDEVAEGDTLMTLEGDKATMDMPSPFAGKIVSLKVAEGDKVKSGQQVAVMTVAGGAPSAADAPSVAAGDKGAAKGDGKQGGKPEDKAATSTKSAQPKTPDQAASAPELSGKGASDKGASDKGALREPEAPATDVYAGPVVRQFARELGVDLRNVRGTGDKGRIQKEDVQAYVKQALDRMESGAAPATGGAGIPAIPDQDFTQFGAVEEVPLTKIAKLTAANMSRNWLNVPAVTQFDDADITDLEEFRKSLKAEADKRGVKVTPVAFLMLACARVLKDNPMLNRSWHSSGEKVIQKHYIHIGMAVDTPKGLLVPVIRDVDKKGIFEIAADIAAVADKARAGKLSAQEMQGGSFSISSLGAIGGRGFTPIVNAPEAAILGVSKASIQPVWNGTEFVPRQLLPLCLSYDHKLVNGANAGKFLTDLVNALGDMRRLLL